ncbi:MAG: hypothetical protein H0U77_05595 [Nocardioidaceae bacterium]|nr:hypothetical protein [Nocardioidaceae bacterium]
MPTRIGHGHPFLGSQAGDWGLTRQQLRQALREGEVRRVLRNVYIASDVPDSTDLRIACLHLVMPPHAVLFGTTAMWALSIDAFQPDERFLPKPSCVVPHGTTKITTDGVRSVEGYLEEFDIVEHNGLRMTVPTRTTVDGLRRLRPPFALSAADAMAHAGLVTRAGVQERIARLRGYPGIVQARYLAHLIDPQIEWPGESWTKLRLVEAGCPIPKAQVHVIDKRGRYAYLDLGYELRKIGCEYDGREVHSLADDREHDAERRTWLRDIVDWRITVARKETVFCMEPSFEFEVAAWLGLTPLPRRRWVNHR